ncbi:isocitrate lyase/phosphoenolpyruvate mutase family protein [Jannaschia sp. Os4]|uniref:isocitrate lyase/PEP mutase family protein n=1 Tax=Jannaschia sp. Os4 TaxID=2807617 RepID=UPI0019398828|nr:isocitrate lyase/phosphoenolpyruvate mutase family protein [Jannaschia sp. Os4]MBM2576699.1 isocitrate lyase/phosphoenolpyruvate mutase family protein [Jannaschia sp. Os4]
MPTFREMHRPGHPFVLANAWDVGSARMLVALGARAVATTSAGHAFTRGLPDGGQVTREEAIAHAADLAAHVDVPVSGDLEDGYGPEPADAAETVRQAGVAGLAGCCIEDVAGDGSPYAYAAAVARIENAVVAARAAPVDHMLCARADGVMHGAYDLDEAIRRLRAFREAGADVLYCPVPGTPDDLRRVVEALDGAPVNALAVGPLAKLSLAEMGEIGVARVSLGSALARATHRVIAEGARAMFGDGRFDAVPGMAGDAVDDLLTRGTP